MNHCKVEPAQPFFSPKNSGWAGPTKYLVENLSGARSTLFFQKFGLNRLNSTCSESNGPRLFRNPNTTFSQFLVESAEPEFSNFGFILDWTFSSRLAQLKKHVGKSSFWVTVRMDSSWLRGVRCGPGANSPLFAARHKVRVSGVVETRCLGWQFVNGLYKQRW